MKKRESPDFRSPEIGISVILISKTTTLNIHHTFLYISLLFSHYYSMKMPNFAFYIERKPAKNFFFSF